MSDNLDKETVAILRRIKRDAEVHWIADRAANSIEALTAKTQSMQKWIDHHNERADKAEAEAARLREALTKVLKGIGDDPCFLDHNGNCQAHFITSPCEVATAREALRGDEVAGGNVTIPSEGRVIVPAAGFFVERTPALDAMFATPAALRQAAGGEG